MTTQLTRGDRVRVSIEFEGKHLRSYNGTVKGTADAGKVYLVGDDGRHKTVGQFQCTRIPPAPTPTLPEGIQQFAEYLKGQDTLSRLHQHAFRQHLPIAEIRRQFDSGARSVTLPGMQFKLF